MKVLEGCDAAKLHQLLSSLPAETQAQLSTPVANPSPLQTP